MFVGECCSNFKISGNFWGIFLKHRITPRNFRIKYDYGEGRTKGETEQATGSKAADLLVTDLVSNNILSLVPKACS